jgi:Flp pilus assembly protein TadD
MNKPRIHEPLGLVERIVVMENHDAAYQVWREAGVKQRILVHVDAHHDMWRIKKGDRITIANFLCAALEEDIVREIFWVVPDETWNTPRTRRPILRHLKAIAKSYNGRGSGPSFQNGARAASIAVRGKTVQALPLGHLPRVEERVLLDIDVDYLVIPRVSYGRGDVQRPLPWCWPEELIGRLGACGLRTDLATLVYSVEGGYTPLKWKYLGDELALHLKGTDPREPALAGMARMRQAALAAQRGDVATAELRYEEARALLPDSAAPCFHLAHLLLDTGRSDQARDLYRQALLQDPSYRTPFNNAGRRCLSERRFADARHEYLRTLDLDPHDVYAHYGLGWLAAWEKRWTDAETLLLQALALDGTLIDACRKLGEVLARKQHHHEAIRAYERSLKLALAGHKSLAAPIKTSGAVDDLLDPGHNEIHVRLAQLYEATGARAKAITALRFGIAGGFDRPLLHVRLARLYLRENQWRAAASEAWWGVKRVPVAVWTDARDTLRRSWRRLVRRWDAWFDPLKPRPCSGAREQPRPVPRDEPDGADEVVEEAEDRR